MYRHTIIEQPPSPRRFRPPPPRLLRRPRCPRHAFWLALPRDPPLIRYRVAKSVACITAAACEDLEVLQWARAHECP